MSTTPPILYTGPAIEASVPFEVRRHLQLLYQKLGNHTQAFALLNKKVGTPGSTTTIFEGAGGGGIGPVPPSVGAGVPVNNQSGVTSYATAAGDDGALIVLSDASPIAVSLTSQTPPFSCFVDNIGAGTATLTPASGTISYAANPGASSMPIPAGAWALVAFDGTNWWAAIDTASGGGGGYPDVVNSYVNTTTTITGPATYTSSFGVVPAGLYRVSIYASLLSSTGAGTVYLIGNIDWQDSTTSNTDTVAISTTVASPFSGADYFIQGTHTFFSSGVSNPVLTVAANVTGAAQGTFIVQGVTLERLA